MSLSGLLQEHNSVTSRLQRLIKAQNLLDSDVQEAGASQHIPSTLLHILVTLQHEDRRHPPVRTQRAPTKTQMPIRGLTHPMDSQRRGVIQGMHRRPNPNLVVNQVMVVSIATRKILLV